MKSDLIAVTRDGPIATVVLNRPEKLNALTKAMWQQLGETIGELSDDDALRCVIVRGAGEILAGKRHRPVFPPRARARQAISTGGACTPTKPSLAECRQLVSADSRHCVGGGLEIATVRPSDLWCLSRFGARSEPRLGDGLSGMAPLVHSPGPMSPQICSGASSTPRARKGGWYARRRRRSGCRRAHAAARASPGAPLVALAQAIRAAARRSTSRYGGRTRWCFLPLRHRRLSHRLRRVSRQAEARFVGR